MSEKHEKIRRFQGKLREKSRKSALNILFGRTALTILMLAAQVFLMLGLLLRWQFASFAYGGSYVLGVFMALYLINRPMNTSARQTWLILILLAPVAGTGLYAYVETDIGHRLVRSELEQIERRTRNILPLPRVSADALAQADPSAAGLAKYLFDNGGFPIYANTHASYYPTGEESISALLDEFEQAQKFIFIEFFIIDEGTVWDSVLEILKRKVAEGVEVRVMYDGTDAVFRLPYRYPEKLRAMGIQCKMFSPLRTLVSTHYNNRDRRKSRGRIRQRHAPLRLLEGHGDSDQRRSGAQFHADVFENVERIRARRRIRFVSERAAAAAAGRAGLCHSLWRQPV